MHQAVNHLVHDEYNHSDYGGSNHHEQGAFNDLLLGGPRSLVTKLVIGLLDIRKQLEFLHFSKISTGREARTPDTWFWRPVLYRLSYSRVF